MPAYFIADITITDMDGYKRYAAKVPDIIKAHGGKYLVRGGDHNIIEGDWTPDRMVVLEFSDRETALNWYNSLEYQAILPDRLNHSKGSAVLVDGLTAPV